MAIARKFDKKSPSQNPIPFFKCEQAGGHGTGGGSGGKNALPPTDTTSGGVNPRQSVPDRLQAPPGLADMQEQLYGRPNLGGTKKLGGAGKVITPDAGVAIVSGQKKRKQGTGL